MFVKKNKNNKQKQQQKKFCLIFLFVLKRGFKQQKDVLDFYLNLILIQLLNLS